MKYTLEIEIDQPREKVIELFDNPENMQHWQPGFLSLEPISGTPGEVGAQSRLKYKMGKRDIEMVETITVRNLPDEFSGTYETTGVWNEVKNLFSESGDSKTKWISHVDFQLSGFMKIIAFLMPGSFKKQSFKYMELFKAFAEK
ncbi:MAG: SRPBCC family protein [Calditrichaeota bacterium]|nr:MAG: SRPBCC family protein [Calditrichota bacterium]